MRGSYLSPEHVRYPHLVIVDHTSQMVRWESVRFEQHHIVWQRLCRKLHIAVYQVGRYCCTPRLRLHVSLHCASEHSGITLQGRVPGHR